MTFREPIRKHYDYGLVFWATGKLPLYFVYVTIKKLFRRLSLFVVMAVMI